jgi:hypothetical protein
MNLMSGVLAAMLPAPFLLTRGDVLKRFGFMGLSLLLILGLTVSIAVPVHAMEEDAVRIAIIDTGISSAAVSSAHLAKGRNYIFPNRSAEDGNGHGTAVAGIIAGSEKAGVKGMDPLAELVPLVYYSQAGEDYAVKGGLNMLAQIIWDAVDIDHVRVINISSGAKTDTSALRDAVAWAERHGVLVVASAGNDGDDTAYYPCAYATVLCVGAVGETEEGPATFSNRFNGVNVLAPGIRLKSVDLKGEVATVTGTSFSAAWVTGAAAALLEADPALTPYQIRQLLYHTARDIGPDGYDAETGWGIADLGAATVQLQQVREKPFPFRDVPQNAYYRNAVIWALKSGITSGISASAFSPEMTTTRAQTITFLWRAMGSPEPRMKENPFEDVKESDYFYKAVLWAMEKGVTSGTSETAFSPHEVCSEAEVITFLWCALGRPGATERSELAAGLGEHYYTDAAAWADTHALFTAAQTEFAPKRKATRDRIVVYLHQSTSGSR